MKPKRILALVLFALLLVNTAFAADYSYGSGKRYTKADIVKIAEELMGSAVRNTPIPTGDDEDYVTGEFAYVAIDAFVLGGGFVMFPTKVEIYDDDTAASVLLRAMGQNGINCEYEGNDHSGFYVNNLSVGSFQVKPEPELERWLDSVVEYYEPENWMGGRLGEFDITNLSGWMFYMNGKSAEAGPSDYEVSGGDVVTLRFTLAGGMDQGGEVFGNAKTAYGYSLDMADLVRALADGELDYWNSAETLNKASLSQGEIDALLRNI